MKKIITYFASLIFMGGYSIANSYAAESDSLFQFAMITDVHQFSPTADYRNADNNVLSFVKYCNEHKELAFAYFGGDFFNAYDTDHSQAVWSLQQSHRVFDSLTIPFYTTRGNHDCNGKQRTADRKPDNSQIITDDEYYEMWSPLSEANPLRHPEGIVVNAEDPKGNYYYRDFDQYKIRMVMMNAYDSDSMEIYGFHGQQLKWLSEQALDFSQKSDRQEWAVVLFSHYFQGKIQSYAVDRIIKAFHEGYDIKERDNHVSFHGKFEAQGPMQVIGCIHGDQHADLYNNNAGYNVIGLTRCFASEGEVGTDDELCYDHFVINTNTKTLTEKRIGRGVGRTFSYADSRQLTPVRACEGVEGHGRYTVGGNNGRVLTVKSLKDNGKPGTLRWAVEQEGARTIRFDVSGTIQLTSPLIIKNDSITIEGISTRKNGMIVLAGQPVSLEASEAIIRYLTIRPGANAPVLEATEGKCGGLLVGREDRKQHHVVLQHLTIEEANGDLLSCARCRDVTIQWCRFEKSLTGEGVLVGGFETSFFMNYLYGLGTHSPKFASTLGDQKWIDMQGCVIENWGSETCTGGSNHGTINVAANHFFPGENSKYDKMLKVASDGTGRYYVTANWWNGEPDSRNRDRVEDMKGVPFVVSPEDQEIWEKLDANVRPARGQFETTCIAIAMFPDVPIENTIPIGIVAKTVQVNAGNTRVAIDNY